jgi:hypothetical protein
VECGRSGSHGAMISELPQDPQSANVNHEVHLTLWAGKK